MYHITNIDKKLMLINIMYITTLFFSFYKIGMQNSIISKAQLKTVTIFLYIYGGHFSKFHNSYNPLFIKRVVVSFE